MINRLRGYTKLAVSVVMLCAISLTIAIVSYQVFSPQGRIFQSLSELWENHPMVLLGLGVLIFVVRHWVNGYHPGQRLSNALYYGTAVVGIVIAVRYLL